MKSKLFPMMGGGLIIFFFLGFCLSPTEAQLTLHFGHYAEKTHPEHLTAKHFAVKVEERTKGQGKITIYPVIRLTFSDLPPSNANKYAWVF